MAGLYDAICTQPLVFPPDVFVSDSLKHLLRRLLEKDPEKRISLVSAVGHSQWRTPASQLSGQSIFHDGGLLGMKAAYSIRAIAVAVDASRERPCIHLGLLCHRVLAGDSVTTEW